MCVQEAAETNAVQHGSQHEVTDGHARNGDSFVFVTIIIIIFIIIVIITVIIVL